MLFFWIPWRAAISRRKRWSTRGYWAPKVGMYINTDFEHPLVGGWTTHAKSQSLDQSPSVYTTSFRCTKSCRSRSASFPEIAVSPGLLPLDGPHSSDLYLPESKGAGFTVNSPWLVAGIITSMAWNPWNFHAATNQILGKSGPKRRRVFDFPFWEKHPKQWFTSGFRDTIFSGKVDGTIVIIVMEQ